MLHVDIPSRSDIENLIAVRSPACISIYLPTTPLTKDAQKDRVALSNHARTAIDQLQAKGVDKRLIWPLEEAIGDLVEDDEFWKFQANSLAVLVTPERVVTFRLPSSVGPLVEVSDRFHIKPLLRSITVNQTAYVLALGQASNRVLEITPGLPPIVVKVPGLPECAPSSVGRSSLVKRGPLGNLQGVEAQNVWLRQYCRQVDSALRDLISGREIPLILAATEPLNNLYRSVSTYAHLAAEGIAGNPEKVSDHDLDKAARTVLDTLHEKELARVREEFSVMKSAHRTSTDIAQIARAATHGVVSTLLVDIDDVVPGTIDDEGKITKATESSASIYGVVDQIAGRALLTGARVMGVRKADIPGETGIAAIYRYKY